MVVWLQCTGVMVSVTCNYVGFMVLYKGNSMHRDVNDVTVMFYVDGY